MKVFITVSGGVAEVVEAPKSIDVEIIDYDNLKNGGIDDWNQLSPEAKEFVRGDDASLAKFLDDQVQAC